MSYPQQLIRTATDLVAGDTVPTTGLTGSTSVMPEGYTHVIITFAQATNAAPTTQLDGSGSTATVSVCHQRAGLSGQGVPMATQTLADHELNAPLEALLPEGHEYSVYVGAVTSANASAERLNIYTQPITLGARFNG